MRALRTALLGPVFVAWGISALVHEFAEKLLNMETREEALARMFPDSFIHNTKQIPDYKEPK